MRPVVVERYPVVRCDVMIIGSDIQSDMGQKVRCPNRASVKVQIEADGNTMNTCDEHWHLFDGHIDWQPERKAAEEAKG